MFFRNVPLSTHPASYRGENRTKHQCDRGPHRRDRNRVPQALLRSARGIGEPAQAISAWDEFGACFSNWRPVAMLNCPLSILGFSCRRLRLRPDGGQEQPYRDSHGNFEEAMDADHPCRLSTRYEHNDG
jgi:hypothetical protein